MESENKADLRGAAGGLGGIPSRAGMSFLAQQITVGQIARSKQYPSRATQGAKSEPYYRQFEKRS